VAALASIAVASENNLGIRDVERVSFGVPTRIGTALLPAGEYKMRHTMEGQEHVMVFEPVRSSRPEVKVKCTLVQLDKKSNETSASYDTNAANERVLRELVFRGNTAKHVF
jgi:HJR/Mrr/RecB family endonuclease